MEQSYKDMAARADNAVKAWRELCHEFGFTSDEADKILMVYQKERIVKLDWGIGHYNVKHGAFMAKDVLQRALDISGD